MYLPALAKDLYRSQKEVEGLEAQLQKAVSVTEQEALREPLRQAKAELEQIRRMLEGQKEQSRILLSKRKAPF